MSRKRGADRELTKDNFEEETEEAEAGTWKQADPEVLKGRKIYKVKRTLPASGSAASKKGAEAAARPAFNLTAATSAEPSHTTENKPEEAVAAAATADSEEKSESSSSAETTATAAEMEANPFFKALGREPGDWDCEMCFVHNKASVNRCMSCEEWKPGYKPSAEELSGASSSQQADAPKEFDFGAASTGEGSSEFAFGFGTESSADGSSAAEGVSFGAPSSSSATEEGSETKDTEDAAQGFSFGDASDFNIGDVAAGGGFSFGDVTGDENSFGSGSSSSSTSGFEPVSGFGDAAALDDAGSGKPRGNVFEGRSAEPRGDEDDKTVHQVFCKVYKMGPQMKRNEDGSETQVGQAFNEQGQGDLRLNQVLKDDKRSVRLLMRAEKTLRLILNSPVHEATKKTFRGEQRLQLISNDLEGNPAVYLLSFSSSQDAKDLDAKLDECIAWAKKEAE